MRDDRIHDHECPGGTRVEQDKVRLERQIPRWDRIRGWDMSLMRRMAIQCACPFCALCSVQAVSLGIMLCLFTTTDLSQCRCLVPIFVRPWTLTVYYGHAVHPHVYLLFVSCQDLFFHYHCAVHLPFVRTNAQVSFPHFAPFFTCLKAFGHEGTFLEQPGFVLSAFALPDRSDNMDPLSLSWAAFLASVPSLPGAPGSL